MEKDTVSYQTSAGADHEETDGNRMCGLSSKQRSKISGTQLSAAEHETMEASLGANSFNQGIWEPYVDKPPQFQETGETLPKDFQVKEGLSHSQEESCRDHSEDCRGVESFGRKDQTFETDIESKDEHLGWLDTRRSEETSEIASHEDKTCSMRDGSKFHPTEEMDGDHPRATQEKEESKDMSVLEPGSPNQALQEFKSVLKESPLLSNWTWDSSELRATSCHALLKSREEQCQCMETLPPHLGGIDQKVPNVHMHGSGQGGKPQLGYNSAGLEKQPSKGDDLEQAVGSQRTPFPKVVKAPPTNFEPTSEKESRRDSSGKKLGSGDFLHFTSEIEHIEEQMARDNVHFVRFETTDIHGVSRSKSIPSRFFRTKAIHGVAMPKGYLELTLNLRDHEPGHVPTSSFNCDIILRPDLSTFRILPWVEQTARVICDPFMVMGNPLLTSPRNIAKQQLSQLRDNGFALYSAFTYEFCIYGIAEIVNSKTISFPAATLLSNHDQSFVQELMDGMYHAGANIESFSSSAGPGQMEISFHPEFGLGAADSAFTFRTGIKEVAKKYNYIASFFTEDGFYNSGILTHSLWDSSRRYNLFALGSGAPELTEIGKNWLAGLLMHSAALSCLMAPTVTCRKCYSGCSKGSKEAVIAKGAWNDNSCAFNIQNHSDKGTWIENQLGSATANPYLVLSATIAAGLDGVKRKLTFQEASGKIQSSTLTKAGLIPLKLEDALVALQEDECIREALGDYFVQYFVNIKQYEVETEELDAERNKFLEYFI
ncbi:lengsin [Protobothrops mucrosquamatus]|uniref:lengsin n=1 Tax=Protobothrops mucrosquamatus TaxID=103944 RepID=UPI000775ACBA|nr:lengsin [Protobothrops mucrosquamatus]